MTDVPICAQRRLIITAVEGEVITLECQVDAHPSNVTFAWLFNNTVDSTQFRKSEVSTSVFIFIFVSVPYFYILCYYITTYITITFIDYIKVCVTAIHVTLQLTYTRPTY